MPIICSSKLFENHNIIYLYSSDVIKNCKKIGTYLTFDFYSNNYEKENYLFLKDNNKIIALLVYFFYEVDSEKIPAIDIVVVDEEYRRKGITTFFYNHLLNIYGKLISGICLNKSDRKIDGSFGLWVKLIKKHSPKLFNIYTNSLEKFSFYRAFKSKHSIKRRIFICNIPRDF